MTLVLRFRVIHKRNSLSMEMSFFSMPSKKDVSVDIPMLFFVFSF